MRSTTRAVERVLERPLLGGVELVVDEQHLGARLAVRRLELLELPFPHVGARIGRCALLHELVDRLDAGRARELAQLGELVVRVRALAPSTARTNPRSGSTPVAGVGLSACVTTADYAGRSSPWPDLADRLAARRWSSSTFRPRAGTRQAISSARPRPGPG